jgi:hypothetical protein
MAVTTKSSKPTAVPKIPESKQAKFRRLANKRAIPLIKRMRLMAYLGNDTYEASNDEIEKLINVLKVEFDSMCESLRGHFKKPEITNIF